VLAPERDFSESHMVLVRVGDGAKVMRDLERANIIVSTCHMPEDDLSGPDSGLRIGTGELTRRGMSEKQMEMVANIIAEVLKHPDASGELRSLVVDLTSQFKEQKYCYKQVV
jgi:glycine hydroxymethyltransferase